MTPCGTTPSSASTLTTTPPSPPFRPLPHGNHIIEPVIGAGTQALNIRKSIVIPGDLIAAVLTDPSFHHTPLEFYTKFLLPHLADAGWVASHTQLLNWWGGVATHTGTLLAPLYLNPVVFRSPTGPVLATLREICRRQVARDLAPLEIAAVAGGLPAVTGAIEALRTDITTHATVRETNETTRRDEDRARRERTVTFTERNGTEVATLVQRFSGAGGDDDLPPVLKTMAAYKDKSRDLVTINLALYTRGAEIAAGTEVNLPKATSHLVSLFRSHNIIGLGLEFGEGLNPFSVACQGHVQTKELVELASKQALMESGDSSITMADATRFQTKDARFPRTVNQAVDKLWGYSIQLDVYLGVAHEFAAAYAAFLPELCPLLINLESIHAGDVPYILSIVIRIMLWVQQAFFLHMRKRRNVAVGTPIPLPDFDGLLDDLRMQTYDSKLPHVPKSWQPVLKSQVPEAVKDAEPSPARIRGGGDDATSGKVTNPNPSRKLLARWIATGFSKIAEMLASKPETAVMPTYAGKPVCLGWALKGYCNGSCARKAAHKNYGNDVVKGIHEFMDVCGVAASP